MLVLTLYATQYSGNTLFGFSGEAYRSGFSWFVCVQFMIAIVVGYLLYAPRLYPLARERGYVTPADYLQDRYGSRALSVLASVLMMVALLNFLLGQLMAMGRALQGFAPEFPEIAYQYGVIVLAGVMVIYGTLGGMRAVAWTDAVQGFIMLCGFGILLFLMFDRFGSPAAATSAMLGSADPDTVRKALPPQGQRVNEWLSYLLLFGLGAALYPQAIQRLYAARSARTLRLSLAIMGFLPFTTVLITALIGVLAIAQVPGLAGTDSDQVLTRMLGEVQRGSLFGYWLVVIMFAAVIAAIMSTADSLLLTLASMFSKDIYGRWLRPRAIETELIRVGTFTSWTLVVVLVWLAIILEDRASLVDLIDRKLDLLVQLVPAFMLGVHWQGLRTRPVLYGLLAGAALSLLLAFGGFEFVQDGKIAGFHPGIYGLLVNLAIATGGSWWLGRTVTRD